MQEELRVGSTSTSSQHGGGEADTMALAAKGKKKAGKKGPKAGHKKKSGGEQQRDMSKVRFACHKFKHYVVQCPNKKKKQGAASTNMEEFASKFDRGFSLVTCLSTCSGSSRVWYIDSGASTHMSGVRECFSELNEQGVSVEVELGDDRVAEQLGEGQCRFRGSLVLH